MPQYCLRLILFATLLLSEMLAAAPLRTVARDSPPIFQLRHGRVGGICHDVLHAISRLDPQLQFDGVDKLASLPAVERGLQSGYYDVICGLAKTPQRENDDRFLGALFSIRHKLLQRADDDINVSSLAELAQLSHRHPVIVRRGSVFADLLRQQGVEIDDSSDDNESNLRKLWLGRGRFFYSAESILQSLRKQYNYQRETRLGSTVLYSQPVYMVSSRMLAPARRQQLEQALQTLRSNGTLATLQRVYDLED